MIPHSKMQAVTRFTSGWARCLGCHGWLSSTRMIPQPRSLSWPTMLVNLWCVWLCVRCQCLAGEVWSHSHVDEWIFGSRIQSH